MIGANNRCNNRRDSHPANAPANTLKISAPTSKRCLIASIGAKASSTGKVATANHPAIGTPLAAESSTTPSELLATPKPSYPRTYLSCIALRPNAGAGRIARLRSVAAMMMFCTGSITR